MAISSSGCGLPRPSSRWSCSISSPMARASSSESQQEVTLTFSPGSSSVRGGGEDVGGRAVIALEADDPGAGKIVLEAQNVVHLGPAPAVDRLIVVSHAADVFEGWPSRGLGVLPLPACGERVGVRGALGTLLLPLTRRAPRVDLSPQAGRGDGVRGADSGYTRARTLPQQAQPEILRHVRVLILVDQDVSEPRLILAQHLALLAEQAD